MTCAGFPAATWIEWTEVVGERTYRVSALSAPLWRVNVAWETGGEAQAFCYDSARDEIRSLPGPVDLRELDGGLRRDLERLRRSLAARLAPPSPAPGRPKSGDSGGGGPRLATLTWSSGSS